MPVDGIGRILCCDRSILTNDGVISSDGSMPIDFGGGTMQIGRLLIEISRFLFLKIFRISLHVSYRFFSLFVPLDLFWQAFLWKATTWLSSAISARGKELREGSTTVRLARLRAKLLSRTGLCRRARWAVIARVTIHLSAQVPQPLVLA